MDSIAHYCSHFCLPHNHNLQYPLLCNTNMFQRTLTSFSPKHFFFFFFFLKKNFWPRCVAHGILVPRPEIKPAPLRWKQSLNRCTAREVPPKYFLKPVVSNKHSAPGLAGIPNSQSISPWQVFLLSLWFSSVRFLLHLPKLTSNCWPQIKQFRSVHFPYRKVPLSLHLFSPTHPSSTQRAFFK